MLTLLMIARNAGPTIRRALESAKPYVDRTVVVLAGVSQDDTEAIARECADEVHAFYPVNGKDERFEADGSLADFSAARNFALRFLPEGSHWCYLDADDELVDGDKLADAVALLESGAAGVVSFPYRYAFDDSGKMVEAVRNVRLFSGKITDWHWVDEVHEWCRSEQDAPIKGVEAPAIVHHRSGRASERNCRILERMLKKDPTHKRARLHYGDALFGLDRFSDAFDAYAAYYAEAEIEPHGYHAATQAAKCCLEMREYERAAEWCHIVIDMRPTMKDGYLLRARVAMEMNEAEKALFWLDQAADKAENTHNTAMAVFTHDYTWNAWNTQYRALASLQRWSEAIEVCRAALHEWPMNIAWLRDWNVALEGERIERSIYAVGALVDHFVRRGDTLKAWRMLQDENLPMTIRIDPRITGLRAQLLDTVKHVWDPATYKQFYDDDTEHRCVGTAVDVYRVTPVAEALRRRGAKRVLDVGSGQGGPAMWLARHADVEVVGLDLNSFLVDKANAEAKNLGLPCTFHHTTLYDYVAEHPGERFDAVLLIEVIEHMAPQDGLQLITQAEEVGDAVILTTPAMFCSDIPPLSNKEFPRDHVIEYGQADLENAIYKMPRRRPWNIHKVWAPSVNEDDGVAYLFPGFASWFVEFDNETRHNPPVTFYLGQGPGWSPLDIERKGLGGSETMAVKMAEEFARNHHPVAIYGDWSGCHNGVIYRHWSEFNPRKPYLGVDTWLFICSRSPWILDEPVNADIKWLWCHDVDVADEVTPERIERVDRVLLLSEWHRRHWLERYPWFPVEKIAITRNAIDPALFPPLGDKVRHRFIWPSSPDRGLDVLLGWWPDIRKMWPDAELHVFYGFDTIDWLAHWPGREWLPWFKAKVLELADQPGVVLRGRVPQRQLYEEMARTQFWLYTSTTAFAHTWNETYCITALECQANGVTPVIADAGALPERFWGRGHLLPWGASKSKYLKALRQSDRLPTPQQMLEEREAAFAQDFASLYQEWVRLTVSASLEDAGKVPEGLRW